LHTEYWTKYAFMFPVSVCVATTAMLTGIGGAALFSPIFIIGFQALGPEFPLATPAEAFNVALITECFGFSSGLLGYTKRGLVDWRVSKQFIAVGLPFGCAGGLAVASADPDALRAAYGALTFFLGVYVLMGVETGNDAADDSTSDEDAHSSSTYTMTLTAFDGTRYEYDAPLFDPVAVVATALGGLLTGLLSVGIGESVVPQLTRRRRKRSMPLPVAAGTSVSVVIAVALAAAAAQAFALYGGDGRRDHRGVCVSEKPGVLHRARRGVRRADRAEAPGEDKAERTPSARSGSCSSAWGWRFSARRRGEAAGRATYSARNGFVEI
jgi:uncharacterized membrane protein YfcA